MKRQFAAVLAIAGVAALLLFAQSAMNAQAPSSGERALKAAMDKEIIDGDLKSAIEQYKKIAAGKDRALAAKALLRMAGAYQAVGGTEARTIYERIAAEFPEQTDAVNEAKSRLASLGTARSTNGILTREVPDIPALARVVGRVSRDGRYIVYVNSNGAVLYDVSSESRRQLSERFDTASFSRDGKQLAYFTFEGTSRSRYLRILNLQEAGETQSKLLLTNSSDIDSIVPHDWTVDKKWIVASLQRKDRSGQIVLVSVADGSVHVLKTVDWRGPSEMFVSPDGKWLAFDLPGDLDAAQRDIFLLALDGSAGTPVVVHPADDAIMGWSPDGRFLIFGSDRTAGSPSLWVLPVSEGKAQGDIRMVKRDLGPVGTMGVTQSGALYLKVATPRNLTLEIATIDFRTERLLPPLRIPIESGAFNPEVSWSADGKHVAFVTFRLGLNGAMEPAVSIRARDGVDARDVRPALGWMRSPNWLPDGRSFLVEGEDFKGRRGIYRIDAQSGEVSSVLDDATDCGWDLCVYPTASPDGKSMYYTGLGVGLVARNLASGSERELFKGAVGKFQPSPDGRYIAMTSGSVVRLLPIAGGESRELMNGQFAGWAPDSQSILALSGTGARITPRPVQGELWRVSLDGQSRKIDIDASKQRVSSYWSPINPDGHFASLGNAETGASGSAPIIRAIENFLPAPSGNTVSGQPAAARTAQLAWFDRTGKELRSVGTASAFRGLELSPDGKRVAIHRHDGTGGDIWILDSQSGSSRRLTTDADGTRDNAMPVWSPDGSQILFRSHRNGRWGLYVKRADGTGSEELLVDSVGNTTMSWSPDGKFVVYGINEPKTGDDLWAISLAGDRKAFPLVQSFDNEAWPQISPDGKWIAYNKEDKGIYVRSFPNGIDEWKVSASGIDPRWRADGKELFFLVPNEIVATEFRVAGAFVQLSTPRKLFRKNTSNFRDAGGTHHAYAVSPDGQRFLIGIDPTSK